jgi:S-formylglutathione hydrolase FrmB
MSYRLERAAVIVASCLLLLLSAGISRVSNAGTANLAGLRGTVSVLQIRGPSDLSPHPVWVWRPPGPDSAMIPVVYYLHGYPGGASDPFSAGIATTLDHLLQEGYPPFVFASVDGNGERHSDTEWANSWNSDEQVMNRVVDTAIPAVEGSHMRPPSLRAIVGFSMGGYGAMNIAMANPGVFGQEASLAGYYVVNDLSDMFGNKPQVIALNTPSAHPRWALGMRVLLDEDASDPFPLIKGQAAWMGGLLAKAGVNVQVHIQPGTHSWAYAMAALKYAFGFFYDGWRAPSPAAGPDAGWSSVK